MLLSHRQILAKKLIQNANDANYRAVSYDVSIGKILTANAIDLSQLKLPPSGVAEVISRETIVLPRTITGLAQVKTDLCNRGILALNTGIIGPGYEGYLSTTLLNFSKEDFLLQEGDVFLRLIFLPCQPSDEGRYPSRNATAGYIRDKKALMTKFSEKFLNLEAHTTEVTQKLMEDYKKKAFLYLPLLALCLTLLTFLLTVGVNYANRFVWSADDVKRNNVRQSILDEFAREKSTAIELKLRNLEDKLVELEKNHARNPKKP